MAKKVILSNSGTEVFAVTEGLVTISYDVKKGSSNATVMPDGRKVILAGTAIPSNDTNCAGLAFENWDVTEKGGAIPLAIGGYVNEANLPVPIDAAAKAALKNVVFLSAAKYSTSEVKIASVAATKLAVFVPATGLKLAVTITGNTFNDDAAKSVNWILSGAKGYYVASVVKTSATVATLTIKSFPKCAPAVQDLKCRLVVAAGALVEESQPAEIVLSLFQAA